MELRLPNLLIIGVSKAGTSSLFSYLSQHPEVCPSRVKETHYFTPIRLGEPAGDLEQYARNFSRCGAEMYRIEATPGYFYGGLPVIRAVKSTLPGVRAVVSLRNPVDRIWSNYQYKLSRGRTDDKGSFETFVDRCEQVLAAPEEVASRAGSYRALLTGFYADFIHDWFVELGPCFKVVFFDDLGRDARLVTTRLLEWLELDPDMLPSIDLAPKNVTVQPRNARLHGLGLKVGGMLGGGQADRGPVRRLLIAAYKSINTRRPVESMDPQMRARLEQIFADANRRLAAELVAYGYSDLPAWLEDDVKRPRPLEDGRTGDEPGRNP